MNTVAARQPRRATRGAAVDRARDDLIDVVRQSLGEQFGELERRFMGKVIGCDTDLVRKRFEAATLEELETWTVKVKETIRWNTER
jgi:hypothetical protein